ncbi:hypothetical protein CPB84DRAFT_1757830 [Gymnopilus junonius]|uniref:C2H2-type domain-containing protein n=1 Tax=Gymnopilus junonius TaxID=109634 RepID=A0A9P5P308_GYMJU|nr:hypothetical protein CPB84DRAFT_1757830 [Gymnopilus junonius]
MPVLVYLTPLSQSFSARSSMNYPPMIPSLKSTWRESYESNAQNTRPTLPPIKELGFFFNASVNPTMTARRWVQKSADTHGRCLSLTFEDVFDLDLDSSAEKVVQPLRNSNVQVAYAQQKPRNKEKEPILDVEELLYEPNPTVDSSLWSQYTVNLGKENGKGPSVFECTFPASSNSDDICRYRGLKQSVKRHINAVHLKQRPWKCLYCYKRFPQKTTAGVHIGTMHSKKEKWLHPCEYCAETFKDPARRYKHTKDVHTGQTVKTRRKDPYAHIATEARRPLDEHKIRSPSLKISLIGHPPSPSPSFSSYSGYHEVYP